MAQVKKKYLALGLGGGFNYFLQAMQPCAVFSGHVHGNPNGKRPMKNTVKMLFLLALLGCQREGVSPNNNCPQAPRFLPLQVGNRWAENDSMYVEVIGTRRFFTHNVRYAVLLNRLSAPARFDTAFYRVDRRGMLVRYVPTLGREEPVAKFCTFQGDRFDPSSAGFSASSVIALQATSDTLQFESSFLIICNGLGCTGPVFRHTYVRDIGWLENPFTNRRFTEARINGRTIRLQ